MDVDYFHQPDFVAILSGWCLNCSLARPYEIPTFRREPGSSAVAASPSGSLLMNNPEIRY